MSGWAVERLAALPDGTIIEALEKRAPRYGWDVPCRVWWVKVEGAFRGDETVSGLAEMVHLDSIRVVSVPVGALLNPRPATVGLGRIDPTSEAALMVVRAAIAHATGEAP